MSPSTSGHAHWRWLIFLGAIVFALVLATACGDTSSTDKGGGGSASDDSTGGKVHAAKSASDWGSFGYDYQNTRHVPFTKITPDNVKQLGVAFEVDFQKEDKTVPGGQQSSPIVADGTIYTTTSFDHVFAVDATSGKVKWHFKPSKLGIFKNFGVTTNRGLGYCGGKLYLTTLDMRIIQIDAKTGDQDKSVDIADAVPDAKASYGYYESSAPICYRGMLYVGSSGADNGVRGFVMAYNASDLTAAWDAPYYTVPPEGQDWRAHGRFHGGGTVWTAMTIDPKSDYLYFSAANPSPDFFPQLRPGANPKVNSLIAVDRKTGEEKWWKQQLANDQWDYDTDRTPIVYDAKIGTETKRVVSVATKEGKWFLYDAKTGDEVYKDVWVVSNHDHPPLVQGKPVTISPSTLGGVNYAPSSYDPERNIEVVNAIESKSTLVQSKSAADVDKDRVRGDVDTGAINGFGETPKGWNDYGTVRGIDLATGKVKWELKTAEPERGGSTTTASGLAFTGNGDGTVRAIDTATGKELWTFQTGAQVAGPPVVYQQGGEEYVAFTLGGSFTSSSGGKTSRLIVFKLGGDTKARTAPVTKVPQAAAGDTSQSKSESTLAEYLQPDPADPKAVTLVLVASKGQAAGGMNFNGFARGAMTVKIPSGWKVSVTFKNASATIPHSVGITDWDHREDSSEFPVAFKGSETEDAASGIKSGTQYFTFTADKEGKYAIVCEVPGHAVSGMWDAMTVVGAGERPSISTKDGDSYVLPVAGAK